jgi:hypothetical protein
MKRATGFSKSFVITVLAIGEHVVEAGDLNSKSSNSDNSRVMRREGERGKRNNDRHCPKKARRISLDWFENEYPSSAIHHCDLAI